MGKTAVVVIHGVGEQRPMGTARSFVRFFAGHFFRSKPDPLGELFELRRLATFASGEAKVLAEALKEVPDYPPDTVFYEYYWAFHYRDTTLAAVILWAWRTLCGLRSCGQLKYLGKGRRVVLLNVILLLLLVLIGLGLIATGIWLWVYYGKGLVGGLLAALGLITPWLLRAVSPVMIKWVGDAARYFGTSPENPIERQQIRSEGVQLLRRLHEQEDSRGRLEYDRIIIVGHSLGSVIAYDVITHYWAQVNLRVLMQKDLPQLKEVIDLTAQCELPAAPQDCWDVATKAPPAEAYQSLQAKLRAAVNSTLWRVSDLVTLGSPLTYARFLLAEGAADLNQRQMQRELPTCPPVWDEYADHNGFRRFVFSYKPVTGDDGYVVPHHAAPFLLTRWTNLYFPADPIGGPLRPFFGWGIRDVPVELCPSARQWLDQLGGAHVRYWDLMKGQDGHEDVNRPCSTAAADALREIVKKGPNE